MSAAPVPTRPVKTRSLGSRTRVREGWSFGPIQYHGMQFVVWAWRFPLLRWWVYASVPCVLLTSSLGWGLLLGLVSLAIGLTVWIRSRRRPGGSPSLSLRDAFWELRRRTTLSRRWADTCEAAGLTSHGSGKPLRLRKLEPTGDGGWQGRVAPGRAYISTEKLKKSTRTLAEFIGCKEVVVKEDGSGVAQIFFHWTDAVGRLVTLADLPAAKRVGHFAVGVLRDGTAATLAYKLSMLVSGLTRQGKSNFAWGGIASLLRDGVPIALYLADTKEVEFAKFEWLERQSGGLLELRGYARTIKETKEMLAQVEKSMGARQEWMRRKHVEEITIPTLTNRLVIVVLDEALDHSEILKAGHEGPIGRIGRKGSASLHVLWLLAQDGTKEAVGAARDLVGQSVCFRVRNASAADVALGAGAVALGGEAHRIQQTGQAYAMSTSDPLPMFFRAPVVTSEQKAMIARGIVPPGMPSAGEAPQESATYIYRNADRKVIYVGRSVNPEERANQHRRDDPWYIEEVDESLTTWKWYPSIPESAAQEEMLIGVYEPKWNHHHNPSSYRRAVNRIPRRRPREVEPPAAAGFDVEPPAAAGFDEVAEAAA